MIIYFVKTLFFLPDNDENIIITTSTPVCSLLTKTTNNLVADNFSNNLVTDYVDEEREGIEFISDVNIVNGEPMEIYSGQDELSSWCFNLIDKWIETKSESSGVRRIRIRDILVQGLCIRGGVQGNRACSRGIHTRNRPSRRGVVHVVAIIIIF